MSMKNVDHRIYRTFEEFEREELRRVERAGSSVDEMLETLFAEELDFEPTSRGRRRSPWDDDEE